jgi:uncharacterized membrane protein (DUF4010 family)
LSRRIFRPAAFYAVAALAGATDVDAITLSMSEYVKGAEGGVAAIAILIAAMSNTIVKCGMAFILAGPALGKPLLIVTISVLAVALASALLL